MAFIVVLIALSPVYVSSTARADFRLCNSTESLVGVAIGYRNEAGWNTEGWWRVPASSCATLIKGTLGSRYYYVYAEDADQGGQWRGPVLMCTSNAEFNIKGIDNCFARGYERTGFFEVDTGKQDSWTVQLTETGQTGSTPSQ